VEERCEVPVGNLYVVERSILFGVLEGTGDAVQLL
jgi:hypothetical protein